jgi:hypothetical protein
MLVTSSNPSSVTAAPRSEPPDQALPTAREITDDHRAHARVPIFLQMIDDAGEG